MSYVLQAEIRREFSQAMSDMYAAEVPLYADLITIAEEVNQQAVVKKPYLLGCYGTVKTLTEERHGAIRLGTANELKTMAALFDVMGMVPVNYYDLTVANIPVHSTAFRAVDSQGLSVSPFRMFVSLLRIDAVAEQDRAFAEQMLNSRDIFSADVRYLIECHHAQGGLDRQQASQFVAEAMAIFKWHKQARVSQTVYDRLLSQNSIIADIVSFKGAHINHLTPAILDIDTLHDRLNGLGIKTIPAIQGPPLRNIDILLRQTSFVAMGEEVIFTDGKQGQHLARFGEIEQRGIALTPKGMALYDELLGRVTQQTKALDDYIKDYPVLLAEVFSAFPDSYKALCEQELAYVDAEGNFLKYEDFLPVSAAGIFTSNLDKKSGISCVEDVIYDRSGQAQFEAALGRKVLNAHDLYSICK